MKNPYIPEIVKIKKTFEETSTLKTVVIDKGMSFIPGQFLELSLLGFGEAPISISSYPETELTVRPVGDLTNEIENLKKGYEIGIRGPYGNGFDVNYLKGKDILLVSGGCGLAPMRSLIKYILAHRKEYEEIYLFYGARNPDEIPYKRDFKEWEKKINVFITVDEANNRWRGRKGLVTELLEEAKFSKNNVATLCGPPVMMKFSAEKLKKMGVKNIFLSLERRMQCGFGKCGHCNIGNKYVCKDGPVFEYNEVKKFL